MIICWLKILFRQLVRHGMLCMLAAVVGCAPSPSADGLTCRIAASSSLAPLVPELSRVLREMRPELRVEWTLGSSGMLALQIEKGAPYTAFLSADRSFIDRLQRGGYTAGEAVAFAQGELILFSRAVLPALGDEEGKPAAAAAIPVFEALLQQHNRLVLAGPDSAPYGHAAREVLQNIGVWEKASRHLVSARSVAHALQYAISSADAGLLSRSALSDSRIQAALQAGGQWVPVDPALYTPILHYGTAIASGSTEDQTGLLRDFLLHPGTHKVLLQAGYRIPTDPNHRAPEVFR
ncbi:MAG: molybdate ABC transporter substrate-binding protein [Spirochaeta sp.]